MNKLVIISGATRGLGFAICDLLATQGLTDIVCLVRNPNHLSQLEKLRSIVKIIPSDFSNTQQSDETENAFSAIDFNLYEEVFYINNACAITETKVLADINSDEIIENVNANITSNLIVVKNFLKAVRLIKTKVFLLNVSSGIAQNPKAGLMMYGLSKTYLDHLSALVNLEAKAYECQLTATSYYPGGINTNMQNSLRKDSVKPDLNMFDYHGLQTQKLDEPSDVAQQIITHFIAGKSGWGQDIISKSKLS